MGIKVPQITLKADYGEENAFGELNLLSIGYGLHQAWVYATMFGTESIFKTAAQSSGIYSNHVTFPFLVSIFVFAVSLLLIAATDQKLLRFYVSKKTLAFGALCMCLGTAILIVPTFENAAIVYILEFSSGLLTGIGSALLIIFWGIAFARCDSSSIVLNTAVAIVVSVAFYAFVLNQIYFYTAAIVTSLVPLAEYLILSKKTPDSFFERKDLPAFSPLPIKKSGFIKCFGIPIFIFGLALGLMRQTYIQSILPTSATIEKVTLVTMSMCAALLILLSAVAIGNRTRRRDFFFRPLIPLIAVTVLFLPLTLKGNLEVANYILLAGYICFEALLWIFFAETSQQFRISPCLVFGLGRGLSAAASCIIVLVIHYSSTLSALISENSFALPLILLVIMFLAYAMFPNTRDIESIVLPCPLIQFATDNNGNPIKIIEPKQFDESAHDAAGASSASGLSEGGQGAEQSKAGAAQNAVGLAQDLAVQAQNATGVSQGTVGLAQSAADKAKNAASSIQSAAAPTQDAAASTHNRTNSTQSAAASTTQGAATKKQISEAKAAMYDNTQTSKVQNDAANMQKIDDTKLPYGRFHRKCEAVANTFLLSKREIDVLFYLAKGHKSSYIQEKLYISEGTAKTHIRHIYRKLNVHTQQELMKLVEDLEVEDVSFENM